MVDVLDRRAFIGRGPELARLLGLISEIEAGRGRTVVLAGEAGVGKSRLVARLADAVQDRARVEVGACQSTRSGGLPYGPIVEILRQVVDEASPATLPALLGPGRAQLTRLLPELAAREADVADPGGSDPTAQVRLFELILGVFERLAGRRPLVLVIEDVQWADPSSLELLDYLVRGLRVEPVLTVVTVRTEATGPTANLSWLAELERAEGVDRIDLEPFGRTEVADQLEALLDGRPPADLVDRLFDRSDGNPFFVEELVLAGAAAGTDLPPVVRDVLAARLTGLSAATRDALRAAAVGGRAIDDELLGDVLRLRPRALASSLREAMDAGILERGSPAAGAVPAFRHALLREAADAELFPAERAELHLAFARALERRREAGRAVGPADLARHWDGAGVPERALRPTIEAALAAESVYAWSDALGLWHRARELAAAVDDVSAIGGLGFGLAELIGRGADCAVLAGHYDEAIGLARAAINAVDPATEPTLAGLLHNRLRWALWESGDRTAAAEAVDAALRLIPAAPPSQARASVLAQRAGILLFAGDFEASATVAREAVAMGRGLDATGEVALATGVLAWDLAALGDVDGGLALFREAAAMAESIGSAEGTSIAAANLVQLLDRVGRSREALDAATEAHRVSERLGVARTYGALLLGYAAKAQFLLGLWDDADRTTELGLRTGATDRAELWLSINRARLLVGRGRFDEAATLLERARALATRHGPGDFGGSLLLAEAELGIWRADLEAVRRVGRAALESVAAGGAADPALAWLAIAVVRAEADAAERQRGLTPPAAVTSELLGQVDGAIAAVLGNRPELAAGPRADAIRSTIRAERSRFGREPDPAPWRAVAVAWDALERPYLGAYARLQEAAATIAGRGSRTAAAAVLAQARHVAAGLGAAPLLARIDHLARTARLPLVAGAAAVAEVDDGGPDVLTAREREVLQLVAAGRTNQQIAERLFITRKTASVHVSNVMSKLGATNRGEAAAAAHRLGLVDPAPP